MILLEDLEEMDKNMPHRFGSPVDVNLNLDNSGREEVRREEFGDCL